MARLIPQRCDTRRGGVLIDHSAPGAHSPEDSVERLRRLLGCPALIGEQTVVAHLGMPGDIPLFFRPSVMLESPDLKGSPLKQRVNGGSFPSTREGGGSMLSGKRLKLTKSALALDVVVRQGWITIPAGEIIRVFAGQNGEDDQMIDVLWEGRVLTMFAIDVTAGCKEITDRGAVAEGSWT